MGYIVERLIILDNVIIILLVYRSCFKLTGIILASKLPVGPMIVRAILPSNWNLSLRRRR